MSFSGRDQQVLDRIAEDLADAAPALAARLAMFTRLTSGEEMPSREKVGAQWRRNHGGRLVSQLTVPLIWLLISITLIATAVAFNDTGPGHGPACVGPGPAACAGPGVR